MVSFFRYRCLTKTNKSYLSVNCHPFSTASNEKTSLNEPDTENAILLSDSCVKVR